MSDMREEHDDINWWKIRYYTQHPFTDTAIMIGNNENQVLSRFKKTDNGDKEICNISKLK